MCNFLDIMCCIVGAHHVPCLTKTHDLIVTVHHEGKFGLNFGHFNPIGILGNITHGPMRVIAITMITLRLVFSVEAIF